MKVGIHLSHANFNAGCTAGFYQGPFGHLGAGLFVPTLVVGENRYILTHARILHDIV